MTVKRLLHEENPCKEASKSTRWQRLREAKFGSVTGTGDYIESWNRHFNKHCANNLYRTRSNWTKTYKGKVTRFLSSRRHGYIKRLRRMLRDHQADLFRLFFRIRFPEREPAAGDKKLLDVAFKAACGQLRAAARDIPDDVESESDDDMRVHVSNSNSDSDSRSSGSSSDDDD
eukprot:TRINITY_DN17733_c0_g1_i1.p1 TRINITY_DN17733_c0_g1~~TRINITY_DN17733_c0_g1_i1.p1  ORF type:complete len:173 (+),score=20.33 TRINITY_DN17733_c0_g1_i1:500-1018(+)